jgi:hypothetical protein
LNPDVRKILVYGDPDYLPLESDDCLLINVFNHTRKDPIFRTKFELELL